MQMGPSMSEGEGEGGNRAKEAGRRDDQRNEVVLRERGMRSDSFSLATSQAIS